MKEAHLQSRVRRRRGREDPVSLRRALEGGGGEKGRQKTVFEAPETEKRARASKLTG